MQVNRKSVWGKRGERKRGVLRRKKGNRSMGVRGERGEGAVKGEGERGRLKGEGFKNLLINLFFLLLSLILKLFSLSILPFYLIKLFFSFRIEFHLFLTIISSFFKAFCL